jgi:hypothetical protein
MGITGSSSAPRSRRRRSSAARGGLHKARVVDHSRGRSTRRRGPPRPRLLRRQVQHPGNQSLSAAQTRPPGDTPGVNVSDQVRHHRMGPPGQRFDVPQRLDNFLIIEAAQCFPQAVQAIRHRRYGLTRCDGHVPILSGPTDKHWRPDNHPAIHNRVHAEQSTVSNISGRSLRAAGGDIQFMIIGQLALRDVDGTLSWRGGARGTRRLGRT